MAKMKGMVKVRRAEMDLPWMVLGSFVFWVKKSSTPMATPKNEVVIARVANPLVVQLMALFPTVEFNWLMNIPTSLL